jgi:diguanylate cyclase (GGDEF)-like protein
MVVDVDDFKRLDDEWGHAEGDRALRAVAGFLRGHLRAHDVCCRAGGGEFAVILPDVGPQKSEILRNRWSRPLTGPCTATSAVRRRAATSPSRSLLLH